MLCDSVILKKKKKGTDLKAYQINACYATVLYFLKKKKKKREKQFPELNGL